MRRSSRLMKFAVVAFGIALAACNTVEGMGEDVQSAGETVEDAAN